MDSLGCKLLSLPLVEITFLAHSFSIIFDVDMLAVGNNVPLLESLGNLWGFPVDPCNFEYGFNKLFLFTGLTFTEFRTSADVQRAFGSIYILRGILSFFFGSKRRRSFLVRGVLVLYFTNKLVVKYTILLKLIIRVKPSLRYDFFIDNFK